MHSYLLSGMIFIIPMMYNAIQGLINRNYGAFISVTLASLFMLLIDLNVDKFIQIKYYYVFIPLELLTLIGLWFILKGSWKVLEQESPWTKTPIILITIGVQFQILMFILKMDCMQK